MTATDYPPPYPSRAPVTTTPSPTTTELAPSYRIPFVLLAVSLPLLLVQIGLAALVGLFGLFLLVQSLTLRLRFTDSALDIYRGDRLIRHFPYAEWQYWEIFWSPVPILVYFREINSIHFLPILFSPSQLRSCLETHCPNPAEIP